MAFLRSVGVGRRGDAPGPARQASVAFLLSLGLAGVAAAAVDEPASAVILVYHRFCEDHLPSTSIRLEQFDRHLEILTSGPYTVLPLEEVAAALAESRALPDRTVAITIDDVSRSIRTEAVPRLVAAGLPFTVFVNTDSVGRSGAVGVLDWDDLRALQAAGATIGAHGASHARMAFMDRGAMEEDLARMAAAFERELGQVPRLFAYPYGEFSADLVDVIRNTGHLAAFGQHSGVAVAGADPFTLPRFALNERYGEAERFARIVESLPFPVTDIRFEDMLIGRDASNPPAIGFTAAPGVGPLDRLACFASNGAVVNLEVLVGAHVELRLDRPFPSGRSRINCTLPAGDGRFRWLGLPFLVPGGVEE